MKTKKITGYQRAKLTAHWIKTKPTDKNDKRVPLEAYIRAVCKKKGWDYK